MKLNLLAIAAHPDDIELSCAGTIIKYTQRGYKTGIVDLTMGELGTRGTPGIRLREAQDAAIIMGVSVRENARFRDGFFKNDEEHQLKLISYIRKYCPEIVLANSLDDRHPDHSRGGRLIADACFLAGLAKVETYIDGQKQAPWRPKRIFHFEQDRAITPGFIVDISEVIDQKTAAIKAYKSQFHNPESKEPETYISKNNFVDMVLSRDSLLGKRIGTAYGEAFYCENIVGIASLEQLLLPETP